MHTTRDLGSVRVLFYAVALSGITSLVAVGCGGADSSSSGTPTGGAGGSSSGTGGATSTGGTGAGGTTNPHAGSTSAGGSSGKSGTIGQGGEAGEAPTGGDAGEAGAPAAPPSKQHSAVTFVAGGAISKSKNFTLIGNIGEALGSTGRQSKSLLHTFVPGVVAAASP